MAPVNTHDEAWAAVQTRIDRALSRPRLGDGLAGLDALVPPMPLGRVHPDFACKIGPARQAA